MGPDLKFPAELSGVSPFLPISLPLMIGACTVLSEHNRRRLPADHRRLTAIGYGPRLPANRRRMPAN